MVASVVTKSPVACKARSLSMGAGQDVAFTAFWLWLRFAQTNMLLVKRLDNGEGGVSTASSLRTTIHTTVQQTL